MLQKNFTSQIVYLLEFLLLLSKKELIGENNFVYFLYIECIIENFVRCLALPR